MFIRLRLEVDRRRRPRVENGERGCFLSDVGVFPILCYQRYQENISRDDIIVILIFRLVFISKLSTHIRSQR